jgi:hypothetical protein
MTDIPKQELLIKLLRMTESDNDAESLSALRKANTLLRNAGWDWERLINGKIRIIEDPFKNLGQPQAGRTYTSATATQAPPPRPAPPPPQPAAHKTSWPLGINPNRFAGFCYCCGAEVLSTAGVIFKPYQYNTNAPDDWKVACLSCNGTSTRSGATVTSYAASRMRSTNSKGKPKPFVSDLS